MIFLEIYLKNNKGLTILTCNRSHGMININRTNKHTEICGIAWITNEDSSKSIGFLKCRYYIFFLSLAKVILYATYMFIKFKIFICSHSFIVFCRNIYKMFCQRQGSWKSSMAYIKTKWTSIHGKNWKKRTIKHQFK